VGYENPDHGPISRFILEMIQDRAIVTVRGTPTGTRMRSINGTISNDLE